MKKHPYGRNGQLFSKIILMRNRDEIRIAMKCRSEIRYRPGFRYTQVSVDLNFAQKTADIT